MQEILKRLKPFDTKLFVASILIPAAMNVYNYSLNLAEVLFTHAFLLMLFELLLGVILFIVIQIIAGNSLSAFGVSIVWWGYFFFFEPINAFLTGVIGPMSHAILIYLPLLLVAALTIGLLFPLLSKWNDLVGIFSLVLTGFMLVSNIISCAINSIPLNQAPAYPYRSSFSVDQKLEDKPDIFWIHTDGMASFDVVEKYFKDPQTAFYNGLTERGFLVNKGASFEATQRTRPSIEILFNPSLYDDYIAPQLASRGTFTSPVNTRKHPELFAGLRAGGYHIKAYSDAPEIIYPESTDVFISGNQVGCSSQALPDVHWPAVSLDAVQRELSQKRFMVYLECFATPIFKAVQRLVTYSSLPYDLPEETYALFGFTPETMEDELKFAKGLNILLQTDLSPQFTMLLLETPHAPFYYTEDGSVDIANAKKLSHYMGNHRYVAKLLLGVIDNIQSACPDAVIILQADHGIHFFSEAQFKRELGESASVKELWNGTLSAICVPDQYQNGEEANAMITPLNMTRYLINRFVGKDNYPYLASVPPSDAQ